MKILSFNICIKIDNADKVAEYLKDTNADIICLQEVMRPLEDSVISMYRAEEVIRKYLKNDYPYYFFAPEWVSDIHFGPDNVPDRIFGGMAEQGKMILSKYPIFHGYNSYYIKDYEFDRDRGSFAGGVDHGRALQVCEIDLDGKLIQIGNVHGTYTKEKVDTDKTILQSKFILEKLSKKDLPTILVGDFNLLSTTESMKMISGRYHDLMSDYNIKTTRPQKEGRSGPQDAVIDYIFIDNNFRTQNLNVELNDISDHYPVIVDFKLS